MGVNRFVARSEPIEVFRVDPATESQQIARLEAVRARRSRAEVESALDEVDRAARAEENVVPACVRAVTAYASVGEIVGRLRGVFGSWKPTRAF